MLCDDIVGHLNVTYQNMSVSDVDSELSLQSLMDMDACIDVDEATFVSPVGVETYGDSLTIDV